MKRAVAALLLVSGCAGVLQDARSTLERAVADASVRQAAVEQLCAEVVDRSWDEPHPLKAQCDHLGELYDQLQADITVLADALDRGDSESTIAYLAFNVSQSARAFLQAADELRRGDA